MKMRARDQYVRQSESAVHMAGDDDPRRAPGRQPSGAGFVAAAVIDPCEKMLLY
jgi:hypothetical protein